MQNKLQDMHNSITTNQPSTILSTIKTSQKTPTHLTIQQENQNNKLLAKNKSKTNKQLLGNKEVIMNKNSKIKTNININISKQKKKLILKQQQNKYNNNKQLSPKNRLIQDRQYRRLTKQYKRVKSLQQQYRQLQQQIKQIKQLVQLQLELINYNTQQINQKNIVINKNNYLNNYYKNININKNKDKDNFSNTQNYQNNQLHINQQLQSYQQTLSIQSLHNCLNQLFSFHSTIQTANSNYLLLSQVNKQQQSQSIFQIHNLQQRIRQLRFLLNGKQDLLAYQTATFQPYHQQTQNINQTQIKKIFIDYHLPRKQSLTNKTNIEAQFRFVQKVTSQMAKLKKSVKLLQDQLKQDNQNNNQADNQQNNQFNQKDSIKQHIDINNDKNDSRYATPTKTTRKQNKHIPFTQCQNIITSAQTSRTQPKKTNPVKLSSSLKHQLTLLPLSTQNYKHSLIYRVGKLQAVEQQKQKTLNQMYQKLNKQYNQEIQIKKKLIKQYELKRDVFSYKKKMLGQKSIWNDKIKNIFNINKTDIVCTDNILDQLKEDKQNHNIHAQQSQSILVEQNQINNLNDTVIQNDAEFAMNKPVEVQHQHSKTKIQLSPEAINPIQLKIKSQANQFSVMELNSSSNSSAPKATSSSSSVPPEHHQHIFHQITNEIKPTKKRSSNNPFLKFKQNDIKRKHFSHQQVDWIIKERRQYEFNDGDKQNGDKQKYKDFKQKKLFISNKKDKQYDQKNYIQQFEHKINEDQQVENNNQKLVDENIKAKSTLRRRRQKGGRKTNQNNQNQQKQVQTIS